MTSMHPVSFIGGMAWSDTSRKRGKTRVCTYHLRTDVLLAQLLGTLLIPGITLLGFWEFHSALYRREQVFLQLQNHRST